jgi:acetyl esterase/lipase
LLQAENDPIDDVENSLVYYAALKKAGASVEMHLYSHGGHAFGPAAHEASDQDGLSW